MGDALSTLFERSITKDCVGVSPASLPPAPYSSLSATVTIATPADFLPEPA
jgi:hypothetical protein